MPIGNVGIGTSTPATLLNVVGTTDASPTTHGLMVFGETNTSNISIDQNEIMARNNGVVSPLYLNHEGGNIILNGTNATGGNVGLGTMSPGSKLDIVGAINNLSLRVTNNTYNDWVLQKRRSDNTQLFGIKETGSNGSMSFVTNNTVRMTVASGGNVGIGTSSPDYKLDVNGTIRATEIKIVSPDSFPDYVFDKAHYLPKLNEVRQYIADNGHLPGIQSAADAKVNGIDLVDMQMKLLKKMEEMTLYILEQQDTIERLEKKLDAVKTK